MGHVNKKEILDQDNICLTKIAGIYGLENGNEGEHRFKTGIMMNNMKKICYLIRNETFTIFMKSCESFI